MPESPRRRSRGVRLRTTVIAVVAVGLVLAIGGSWFLIAARGRIRASIETAAGSRLDAIVALAAAGALGSDLPGSDPDLLAQVVDPGGVVVAADAAIAGLPPFLDATPAPGERIEVRLEELYDDDAGGPEDVGDDGPYVVVAQGIPVGAEYGVAVVAASLEDAAELEDVAVPLLLAGLPVLLVIVGMVTWLLTGRALRPVEEMRAEAERISGTQQSRRLPVPATGDEIERLAETLNAMLVRLEGASERQRRFIADASHELKSPLAALRSMVEVTAADPARPTDTTLLRDLAAEIDRMEHLVGDLLELSRLDEGSARPGETVDFAGLVREAIGTVPAPEGVAIRASCDGAVQVQGDAPALRRMLMNLLANASGHAAEAVLVTAEESDGRVVVVVNDDGPGIAPEDRERVFDRFVRLDPARSRADGGSGLGLSVARSIARSHGGDITITESPLGGAAFRVVLPAGD